MCTEHLITLACRLDFSFSSCWLSSSDNSVADSASCFSFSRMFLIAPCLNPKPSSKVLQLGGTTNSNTFPRPSHSTYGTGLRRAHKKHTPQDNDNLSRMSNFTTYTTLTAPSFILARSRKSQHVTFT